ncbi:uncharacterized protein LOC134474601 [Cavia porcellus]|uniref:uncharacterized protein LOC134474601 n=1 Tax=Cavia porcellus TaxID=10141 RepID=UPI002FE1AE50
MLLRGGGENAECDHSVHGSRRTEAARGPNGEPTVVHLCEGILHSHEKGRSPRPSAHGLSSAGPPAPREPAMPGAWPLALLLLLPSACCPPPRAQEPTAPLRNLRVEPGSRRLTWDLQGNASGIQCFQSSYPLTDSEEDASFQEAEDDQYCEYHTMSFCTVTNYTVRVTQPPFSAWILFPQPAQIAAWRRRPQA